MCKVLLSSREDLFPPPSGALRMALKTICETTEIRMTAVSSRRMALTTICETSRIKMTYFSSLRLALKTICETSEIRMTSFRAAGWP